MDERPPEGKESFRRRRALAVAAGAGVELLVWTGLGVYAGRRADERLGTEPWLLLVSALAGISFGLYRFVRETSVRPDGPA